MAIRTCVFLLLAEVLSGTPTMCRELQKEGCIKYKSDGIGERLENEELRFESREAHEEVISAAASSWVCADSGATAKNQATRGTWVFSQGWSAKNRT